MLPRADLTPLRCQVSSRPWLASATGFDGHGMHVIRRSRYQVHDVAGHQPPIWTAIEFEAPEENADELAGCMLRSGWYANWNSDTEATVVLLAMSSGTGGATRRGQP